MMMVKSVEAPPWGDAIHQAADQNMNGSKGSSIMGSLV